MKGEIESAKEAYHMLEVADAAVHKTKKMYETAHNDHTSLQNELTTAQSVGVQAKIEKVRKLCMYIAHNNILECLKWYRLKLSTLASSYYKHPQLIFVKTYHIMSGQSVASHVRTSGQCPLSRHHFKLCINWNSR